MAKMTNTEPFLLESPRLESTNKYQLNGKVNDSRWDGAATIADFVLLDRPDQIPENKTSAKLWYDSDYLYLGFIFYDKRMDRIIPGIPADQTIDAPISSSADCGEVFVANPKNLKTYFQLRFTPSGAKEDSVCTFANNHLVRDPSWNGKWEVKTALGKDFWTAEVRIPFSLLGMPGGFAGTPLPGSEWRVNMCRVSSTTGEFSQWSPTGRVFHAPDRFGKIRFRGWNNGEVALAEVNPGAMILGKNTWSGTLKNMSTRKSDVTVTLTLREGEDESTRPGTQSKNINWEKPWKINVLVKSNFQLMPKEEMPVLFPYEISNEGDKSLLVQIDWDRMKKGIFRGTSEKNVYPLNRNSEILTADLAEIKRLSKTLPPTLRQHYAETKIFDDEIATLEKLILSSRNGDLEMEKRISACEQARNILDRAKQRYATSLYPYLWCVKNNLKEIDFCIGQAPSTEKVFRDGSFSGDLSDRAEMSMAGNEYRSLQFVILYLSSNAGRISFSCSDLKSDNGGIIPAGRCSFDVVGYLNIGDTGRGTRPGAWPDVLYPSIQADQTADKLQPVMWTVKTDLEQKAGIYRGKVLFSGDKQKYVIDVSVKVFSFSLPQRKTLKMNIWFWSHRPLNYYGLSPTNFLGLYRQFMDLRGRFNFASGPRGDILEKNILIKRNKEGRVTFDFSKMEPFWESSIQNGANVLNIDRLTEEFLAKPGLTIFDEQSGNREPMTVSSPKDLADQYMAEVLEYFKKKGWLDMSMVQVGDEPWSLEAQEKIKDIVKSLKKISPEFRITSAGTVRHHNNLDGVIDVWCPQFRQYDPADYRDLKPNEKLWFYQCFYKPLYPMYQIDRPGIEPRITALLCWKAGAEGFLYWTDTQWDDDKTRAAKLRADNRWLNENWIFPWKDMPGDGCFIYPMKDRLVPSLRAQFIRDGVNDFEYLSILKKYFEKAVASRKLDAAAKNKIEKLLQVPEHIVASCTSWTKSPVDLDLFRLEVADAIESCLMLTGEQK